MSVRQFKDEMEFLLSRNWRQYQIGELIGQLEGNWSNYLRGIHPITGDIISEFRFAFKKVLKNRSGVAPSDAEPLAPAADEKEFEYQQVEPTADQRIDVATRRLESVISRLENSASLPPKPPAPSAGEQKPQ